MKKHQLPSKHDFQALYAPNTAEFDERIHETLCSLRDNEEVPIKMKKRLSLGLIFALALILISCVAMALSTNVFGLLAKKWNGDGMGKMYQTLDHNGLTVDSEIKIDAQTDAPFKAAVFTLSQSYYDGESLSLAYTLANAQDVIDYTWLPSEEELTQMEKDEGYIFDPDFIRTMTENAAKSETGTAGAIVYQTYLSDGVYLSGTDEYLCLSMSDEERMEDGTLVGAKHFETPLLKEALNQDELDLDFILYRAPTYHYYDGASWYVRFSPSEQTRMTVTISRNQAHIQTTYPVIADFKDYSVKGALTISNISVSCDLEITGKNGLILMPEDSVAGSLLDYSLSADGEELGIISGGASGVGGVTFSIEGTYFLPSKSFSILTLTPLFSGEQDDPELRQAESIVVPIIESKPTAIPHI